MTHMRERRGKDLFYPWSHRTRSLIRIKFEDIIFDVARTRGRRTRAYPRGILPSSFLFSIQGGTPEGSHNSSYRSIAYAVRKAGKAAVHRAYPAPAVSNSGNPVIFRTFKYVCTHARAARYTRKHAFVYRHTPDMQIIEDQT